MGRMSRDHLAEAAVGLLVVLLAIAFVLFAWSRTGGGTSAGAVHVTAIFPNASGVSAGTDVRVAGLKIGTVSAQRLDPKTWQAEVVLAIDPKVKVPNDSSATITSEGLLGSTYVSLTPGGAADALKEGDTIVDTQGAVDLMGMIGQFINKSGDTKPAEKSGGLDTMGDTGAASAPGR